MIEFDQGIITPGFDLIDQWIMGEIYRLFIVLTSLKDAHNTE